MKRFSKLYSGIWLVLLALSIGGCYPDQNLFVEDLDIVGTRYDVDANFDNFNTYVMPDSIVQVGDPDEPGYIELDLSNQDQYLAQVRSRLADLGYVEEQDPEVEPDVVVLLTATASENYAIFSNPGWWGWWGWYPWYPGWGWGGGWYPGYPYPPTTVVSYPVGTLFIDMLDGGEAGDEEEQIPAVWTGILNGLLVDGGPNRVTNGIDQMFEQSPYLQTN